MTNKYVKAFQDWKHYNFNPQDIPSDVDEAGRVFSEMDVNYELVMEGLEKAKKWDKFDGFDDILYGLMDRLGDLHKLEREFLEASIMMSRKVMEHQTIAETEIHYQRELKKKLEAAKKVLDEDWEDFNAAYNQDDKRRRHPRWKLKEILEETV